MQSLHGDVRQAGQLRGSWMACLIYDTDPEHPVWEWLYSPVMYLADGCSDVHLSHRTGRVRIPVGTGPEGVAAAVLGAVAEGLIRTGEHG